jgi:hypothetical protein
MRCQPACKPGSVGPEENLERGDHSSGTAVTGRLEQPTRATDWKGPGALQERRVAPIRFCSWWGLPCRPRYRGRGALLPHPFTLTPGPSPGAVCFLWHCPWGCPRRTLSGTTFPWSPDFPLRTRGPERPPGRLTRGMWLACPGGSSRPCCPKTEAVAFSAFRFCLPCQRAGNRYMGKNVGVSAGPSYGGAPQGRPSAPS